MAELSGITKHPKKGKLHHTVVRFADEDRILEYTIPAKDRFKLFEKERFIFFEDCCVPFPEDCEKLTFMGFLGSSIIFTFMSFRGTKIVSISPTSSQPITTLGTFQHYWKRDKKLIHHPVIDRLLEVNDAKEIHIFTNEDESRDCAKMFAVNSDNEISVIKFLLGSEGGGIDNLIHSTHPSRPSYIFGEIIVDCLMERLPFLIGKANGLHHTEFYDSIIMTGPNDVVEPGKLYWRVI
ncbi:hypothetical protein IKF34_02465 [Candidatus Saccharibacteria bacterium]|nr:hypothetical protein [Candidatus Saccharibacteria bacterium]